MCVYVYVSMCVYVHVYVYMCVWMHVCVQCMSACMRVGMYVCYVCVYICVRECVYVWVSSQKYFCHFLGRLLRGYMAGTVPQHVCMYVRVCV